MSIHMRDISEAVFGLFQWHHTDDSTEPTLDESQQMLLEAYRSGQVPEAAWQEHLELDPDLARYWRIKPRH